MEKTTKRKIGYIKPNKDVRAFLEQNHPTMLAEKYHRLNKQDAKFYESLKNPITPTAKQVIDWLKSHPFFAWGRMCDHLGIDKGNFSRTLNTGTPGITEKNAAKIAGVISKYGFCG